MRVIGIDPGTAIVGYGIIDYNKNKYSIVDYGVILTSKDLSNEERLEIVYNELDKILKKYKPEFMAIEDLFYFKKFSTSFKVLSTALFKAAPDKFFSVVYKTEI